jgi:hypothetical protein
MRGARHWWLMPLILATQGTKIRRTAVRSQPGQIIFNTLSQKKKKNPSQKRAGEVAQGVGPEFKTQSTTATKKLVPQLGFKPRIFHLFGWTVHV